MDKVQSQSRQIQLEELRNVVAQDLTNKLQEYKDPKIGLRLLAAKMDINERTFKRLIKKENRPTYQTLLKIYGTIFNTQNPAQILKLVPEIVSEEILKHYPEAKNFKSAPMPSIESELLYDRCFSDLYILASCGPLSLEFVQYRYGMLGVETLERMVELLALKKNEQGQYEIGENQVHLSGESLKRIGLSITEKFSKPKEAEVGGNNLIGFYADGISDEAYNEWLKIDERAFKEKINIANKSKGNKKVFTYMVTDTLNDK